MDALQPTARLRPVVGVGLLTLYGLGTTVGAGIYALIGKVAGVAGYYAPVAFLLTALIAGLSAMSFAELSSRLPKAAAAALYVQTGFGSPGFARLVGLATAAAGLVSSAALVNAFYGYLGEFVDLPRTLGIGAITTVVTALAVWGIAQSLRVAALITLVEIGGLLLVVGVNADLISQVSTAWQAAPKDFRIGLPIISGMVLAFYAYIGFEDMVDLAEEVKDVRRTLPLAIGLTLLVTTILYTLLALVGVLAVPAPVLAASDAPVALLYAHGGGRPELLSGIALFAIINGVLIQIIMSARVFYGLASRHQLPGIFAKINSRTQTPLVATLFSGACVLSLALLGGLTQLAAATSLLILGIFAVVNLALWNIKRREAQQNVSHGAPRVFAFAGFVVCTLLIVAHLLGH